MADINALIEKEELKRDIIDGCLSDEPHKLYVVYDELMDELIVKLVPPDALTSVYHLEDNIALLVDLESLQIVGFHIFDFQEEHLPENKKFQKLWYELEIAENLKDYQVIDYTPKRKNYFSRLDRRKERREAELLVDIYCESSKQMADAIS